MKKKSLIAIGLIILSSLLIGCTIKSEKAEKSKIERNYEKAEKFRIERNYEEAAKLYEEMAKDGDSYAMWRLNNAYRKGQGVPFNLAKADSLLNKSAKAGCEQAIFDLAYKSMIRYVDGEEISDPKIPAEIENLVSKSKNPYVLSRYAELADFLISPRKALSVMNSITNKEDPSYLLAIGKFYKLGIDTLKANHIKAIKSLEKAFEHGEDDAAIQLAYIYEYSENEDISNKEKAKGWLKKGVECGDCKCMYMLAQIYQNSKKIKEAETMLIKAANNGSIDACLDLAITYEKEFNRGRAFHYYMQAYNYGDIGAARKIGRYYEKGLAGIKNLDLAEKYYAIYAEKVGEKLGDF
jgi:TPR repeat protein